jgi:probable HAF family extracellular repeat protein
MKRFLTLVCTSLLALAGAAVAVTGPALGAAVPTFRAVDLGTLGGVSSRATAVNNRDEVVGVADTPTGERHVFLWRDGTMIDLNMPGCVPFDVNDHRQVVGWCENSWGLSDAFFWEDGVKTDLSRGTIQSIAWAINNRGEVVGFTAPGDGTMNGFLWRDGRFTDLPLADPRDINDRGQVVGGTFRWQRGRLTDLGIPVGHINNRGWITGAIDAVAVLWRAGTVTDLSSLGELWTEVLALNDPGQLLIHGVTAQWRDHYFLWYRGRAVDLANLGIIVPNAGAAPNGLGPVDINNRGHLAGTLNIAPDDRHHAVLWR